MVQLFAVEKIKQNAEFAESYLAVYMKVKNAQIAGTNIKPKGWLEGINWDKEQEQAKSLLRVRTADKVLYIDILPD